MAIRQARLIALLLIATIVVGAVASVLWFGPHAPFLVVHTRADGALGQQLDTSHAAVALVGYAVLLSFAFDRAARVRRWRRNLVQAGATFATAWISGLTFIVLAQWIAWAEALGHPVAREPAMATGIAFLVLLKANFVPKSRPAWFNGTTLPLFAPNTYVWRRVHRASALRLTVIAGIILSCVVFRSSGLELKLIVSWLLGIEIVLATLHGLWLGGLPWHRRVGD